MFKIRHVVQVVLLLVQGIFEVLRKPVDFSQLEEELHRLTQEAAGTLLVHTLEEIDRRLLAHKNEGLKVVGSRKRTLITTVGEITIKRRLYVDREGHYTFLLDKALGLKPRKRVSKRMCQLALDLGTEMSFRRAANILGYITPTISHTGVWNAIQEAGELASTEADRLKKDVFEKGVILDGQREVGKLFIEADEVWVRKQRGKRKEGLGVKLVVGYEGKSGPKRRLENRRTVAGIVDGQGIWEEASCDFGQKWVLSQVKQIRIGGDGAPWIKSGTEHFLGASYHLDPFHLRRRLTESLSKTDTYKAVNKGIEELDREAVVHALDQEASTLRGNRKKRVRELKKYLLNNWSGIAKLPEEERLGTIEGQVRHTIARRMKNIGGGWSPKGANRMARLLAARANEELGHYVNAAKCSLTEIVGKGGCMEKVMKRHHVNTEAWPRVTMPALRGSHAGKPWIRYILKEIAAVQGTA